MDQSVNQPSREQQMYWNEMFQLKIEACYIRDYRNEVGRWVTGLAAVRAVTSTSTIGAWLIWKRFAFLWAGLIAASQLIDALKHVFPFYKRRKALSGLSKTLNRLFVEAQRNWDEIASGQCSNAQIRKFCHQLRSRRESADARYLRDGLGRREEIAAKAQLEAEKFFEERYNSVSGRSFDA